MMPMPTPGSKLPADPGPDGNTPERDGRTGSLPGPNAKRPSSANILANLNKKRKASDMEETGDIYNATHFPTLIKREPGSPIHDSRASGGSNSPNKSPVMREPSTDGVLQGHHNHNGNSEEHNPRDETRLGDSGLMAKRETDSPDQDSRQISDAQDRMSSPDLTEPDMWDVSESELHTSAEEDSSDGESVGSAFSLGMERQESEEPKGVSRAHDALHQEESDEIRSRSRPVRDQNSSSRKRPNELIANGSNSLEQDAATRNTLQDHDRRAGNESSEIPENGYTRGNTLRTVSGKPRQRAMPKNPISARDISRSWKTANPADKMLMKMKEKGCDWLEIRKAWQDLTGEWQAASTLPNRYSRVKINLTRMKPGDGQRLLNAAADVEGQFQRAKWRLIAEAMERAGAAKYSNAFIQKKYDELSRNPGLLGSMIDDESSDASESDTVPGGDNVARLRGPGVYSKTARAQPRREDSRVSSHANTEQPHIASGSSTLVLGEDKSPESERPSGSKTTVSHEEAKYMAGHKALNASNQAKSWEVIAQECGIIAPLNDITQALEQAGFLDANESAREADLEKSARVSRVEERQQGRGTNSRNGGASKESTVSKHVRKGVYPSVHVDKRLSTTVTPLQGHGTSELPTDRSEPDQLKKGSQNAGISKKKVPLGSISQGTRVPQSKYHHRRPRPHECASCFGRYRKRSGLKAHWKRNPGCNPKRPTNAEKTFSKETATTMAPRAFKKESITESLARAPKVQVVIEISSKEPTPEIQL